jgi:hypothetical protein
MSHPLIIVNRIRRKMRRGTAEECWNPSVRRVSSCKNQVEKTLLPPTRNRYRLIVNCTTEEHLTSIHPVYWQRESIGKNNL